VCIGSSFALLEGTLITAMTVQRFTFEPDRSRPVQPEATVTLRPRHGLPMSVMRVAAHR
jgi:cytochrome P450